MTDPTKADTKFMPDTGQEADCQAEPMILEAVPRAGDLCPVCAVGKLDYDGLLNLSCPVCGFCLAGCFT